MNPSNWQTKLSTIRKRTEYAFNKSLFCDVEFSVVDSNGVKVAIPANKYILAVSSPVFEAMFYGHLAESKPTIDLPDCTKEGLQEMLRYVSTDEVKLTGDNVVEVLYLADKYMMPFLKEKCKNFIGPDDVLSVLPEVQKISDEKLEEDLWEIVDRDTRRTVLSKAFLNVSREMLCQILVRDTLNITDLDLFRAVDRWAEEKIKERGLEGNGKNKRSILGEEVIRLIRFPLMSEKEFVEVVLPTKILDEDELIELFQSFQNVSPATNMFSKTKRHWQLDGLFIPPERFGKVYNSNIGWEYDSSVDAINFTVNKSVVLVGVQMFGSQGSTYDVELKICKGNQIMTQLSSDSSFVTDREMINGLYYGFTVNLNQRVKLYPKVTYTVKAKISGPLSCYGKGGKTSIVANGITITYETSSKSKNGTSKDCGQFPTLIFHKL